MSRIPAMDSRRGRSAFRDSGATEPAASTNAGVVKRVSVAPTGKSSSGALEPTVVEGPPAVSLSIKDSPRLASGLDPNAAVIFSIEDLARLQNGLNPAKEELHGQARGFLNEKIRFFAGNQADQAQHQPVDEHDWPTWREYIATHAAAAEIVGSTGVIGVRIEEIEGTCDGNRGGARRVDIVVYNADGKHHRLHPGSKRKNDAQVILCKTIIGAAEPIGAPAADTYSEAPLVYTRDDAEKIPQVDRMGRRKMFDMLQKLLAYRPLELMQVSIDVFPWWLWLPTTGPIRDAVIGIGIERIALVQTKAERTGYMSSAKFLIVQTDKTAVLLNAFHGEGRHRPYYHEVLETDSDIYTWWVNWKPRDRDAAELSAPSG